MKPHPASALPPRAPSPAPQHPCTPAPLHPSTPAASPPYPATTTPQDSFTTQIVWGPVSNKPQWDGGPANVEQFSAVCYYYGVEQVTRRPGIPLGMVSSNWPGTKIEQAPALAFGTFLRLP